MDLLHTHSRTSGQAEGSETVEAHSARNDKPACLPQLLSPPPPPRPPQPRHVHHQAVILSTHGHASALDDEAWAAADLTAVQHAEIGPLLSFQVANHSVDGVQQPLLLLCHSALLTCHNDSY